MPYLNTLFAPILTDRTALSSLNIDAKVFIPTNPNFCHQASPFMSSGYHSTLPSKININLVSVPNGAVTHKLNSNAKTFVPKGDRERNVSNDYKICNDYFAQPDTNTGYHVNNVNDNCILSNVVVNGDPKKR